MKRLPHSYKDDLIQMVYFPISTTVMKTHVAVQLTSLVELGILYSTCITFHFRDLRDSPHSSSFDMMLICICSEKCYDVLKILYFRSKSFIIQRHVDTLASKYVCGCRHKPGKSGNGSHIAVFHPECIHSAEQCTWIGLLFS